MPTILYPNPRGTHVLLLDATWTSSSQPSINLHPIEWRWRGRKIFFWPLNMYGFHMMSHLDPQRQHLCPNFRRTYNAREQGFMITLNIERYGPSAYA